MFLKTIEKYRQPSKLFLQRCPPIKTKLGQYHTLIIYMKKFLDCDWLRGMQSLGNTVQKKGNLVQKRVTNVTFWLGNKQRNPLRANQMRRLNGAKFGSTPDQFRAKTTMVGVCSTSSLATETTVEELKNCSKTKTLRKALVFGSLVGRIGA